MGSIRFPVRCWTMRRSSTIANISKMRSEERRGPRLQLSSALTFNVMATLGIDGNEHILLDVLSWMT